MLQYINVNKIYPHPDNPRKDLGDLTELAESIKAKGILQNLTVVPWFSSITRAPADDGKMDDRYVAVIGHRRLAAAKFAGLKEVPCVVSDMGQKEQVATMLLENMQRSDLTVYEQAQGFQMMLDFGDTVNDIAEQTGFSKTTVHRRVKLLELDQDKFKASLDRGATLMDYAALDKIKDTELKNKVLESIGTRNFDYELRQARDQEKINANRPLWIEALEEFAKDLGTSSLMHTQGKRVVNYYNLIEDADSLKVPDDADTIKYYYLITSYNQIQIYREDVMTEAEQKAQIEHQEMADRRAALDKITERAYELRRDFVKEYQGTTKHLNSIIEFWVRIKLSDMYRHFNYRVFAKLLGVGLNEEGLAFEDIADKFKASLESVTLAAAYCEFADSQHNGYFRAPWHEWPRYEENEELDYLYDTLEGFGYKISDEEQALRDGTHELFAEVKE